MALTLVTEIFDAERFARPRELMSYLGLTPSLYQSTERGTRGGITKTGNRYARWALGQIAKKARHRPHVGAVLKKRREGKPTWAIAIADRAQQRLYQRHWALQLRGKLPAQTTTAVARELVGFVWEALIEVRRQALRQAA